MRIPDQVYYIRLSETKQARICNLQKKKCRPQGIILPTGGVSSLLALLQVSNILLRQLTGCLPTLCAVWGVQLKAEPPFGVSMMLVMLVYKCGHEKLNNLVLVYKCGHEKLNNL